LTHRHYRHKINILCYHGFSYHDEHLFRPKLFMSPTLFAQRLELIKQGGFNVISLDKACQLIASGETLEHSIVLTIDDGWFGVADFAAPLLNKYQFNTTLYLTTYYVQNRIAVVNMMVAYLLWKTSKDSVDLSSLDPRLSLQTNIKRPSNGEELAKRLTQYCERLDTIKLRGCFLQRLAQLLEVTQPLQQPNMFKLIDLGTASTVQNQGLDLQLHSHRHHIGKEDLSVLQGELDDNVTVMRRFTQTQLQHFCYPSGFYTAEHQHYLQEYGMISATTCHSGMCDSTSDLFSLPRFLDGQNITKIEFEAELYGFAQLMRSLKKRLSKRKFGNNKK